MAPCSRAQILRVWSAYVDHRRPYVKPSTFAQDYPWFTKRFANSPQWIATTDDVVQWLLENHSHETARRTLQQIKAAFKWAALSGTVKKDPFLGVPNFPRMVTTVNQWRAFEPEERKAILNAFEHQPAHYRRWTWGLFLTGCRPEEARALKIESVSKALNQLAITQAWRMGQTAPHATKTGATTPDFPVNNQLGKLLKECIGDRQEGWLFTGVNGGPLNYQHFQRNCWKPTVTALAEAGHIAWYLPQKNARHTWITSMLQSGMNVETVAYLARNSPDVIYRYYAQRQKNPTIPEI